jgi:K+-transporting ATPase KdpF subunit
MNSMLILEYLAAGAVIVFLFAYLTYSLVLPEKF